MYFLLFQIEGFVCTSFYSFDYYFEQSTVKPRNSGRQNSRKPRNSGQILAPNPLFSKKPSK